MLCRMHSRIEGLTSSCRPNARRGGCAPPKNATASHCLYLGSGTSSNCNSGSEYMIQFLGGCNTTTDMSMFGAFRLNETTRDLEHVNLVPGSGLDARGYTLMACDPCRARKVSVGLTSPGPRSAVWSVMDLADQKVLLNSLSVAGTRTVAIVAERAQPLAPMP